MVDSYKKLDVWSRSVLLVKRIYIATDVFPKKEQFRLVDQMCRAASSIPANIAEGSARKSTKDFMRFIAIALGSTAELRTHSIIAFELEYITQQILQELEAECDIIGRQLQALYNSMERKAAYA